METGNPEVIRQITFPAVIHAQIGNVHCVYNTCQSQEDLEAYLTEHRFRIGRDSLYAEPPASESS